MIPVKQRITGPYEADQRGDCYKCAVASILELPYEDVPHFAQGEPNPKYGAYSNLCRWLKDRGYPFQLVSRWYLKKDATPNPDDLLGFYDFLPEPKNWHPGYWIGIVKSKLYEQTCHAVVMKDGHIAWDPSPRYGTPEYDAIPYAFCAEEVFVTDFSQITRLTWSEDE